MYPCVSSDDGVICECGLASSGVTGPSCPLAAAVYGFFFCILKPNSNSIHSDHACHLLGFSTEEINKWVDKEGETERQRERERERERERDLEREKARWGRERGRKTDNYYLSSHHFQPSYRLHLLSLQV